MFMEQMKLFVCQRMNDLREQAGYSSEEFRQMVDITPLKYSQIEAGEVSPSCYQISRIARALNVSTDYLLGMDIHMPPEIPPDDSPEDNFKIRFIRLLRERNESLDEISTLTGKGSATVRRWETGQNIPSTRTLVVLALHFGCSIDYLLGIHMQRTPGAYLFNDV